MRELGFSFGGLMELGSKEFIDAINSKSFDRQFKAFAKHQVLNMKYFFSTEDGKKYYEAWLKKNKKLQRQYEVNVIQTTYDYDDDEEDD